MEAMKFMQLHQGLSLMHGAKARWAAQEDAMGCGVACVANRLGITYRQALELFDRPGDAVTIGYKCKYVVDALNRAGIRVRLWHIKAADRDQVLVGELPLPLGVIVLLERSAMYPRQHYLLRIEDGWLDPWINMLVNPDVTEAQAGVRAELPGRPYYFIA